METRYTFAEAILQLQKLDILYQQEREAFAAKAFVQTATTKQYQAVRVDKLASPEDYTVAVGVSPANPLMNPITNREFRVAVDDFLHNWVIRDNPQSL